MAQATPLRTVRCVWPIGFVTWADTRLGALQFLGNLFEYFLVRKNHGKEGKGRLTTALENHGLVEIQLVEI
jgi:hypothetical protein